MNLDEVRVFKYLKAHFGENVVFEPDGKVPPDFLVDSAFAVEARRLNQHFFSNGTTEGLEQLEFPIFDMFNDVLKSFDSLYKGSTFWVSLDFERPLSISMRRVKKDMEIALRNFLASGSPEFPYVLPINPKIEFTIYSSQAVNGRVFRPAGGSDGNAGGWVISIYIENLQQCVTEKSNKIATYLPKYREWWLYLVDHMGWGLDTRETQSLVSSINDIGNFDRVCIISADGESLLASVSK
jgi:hypothetical protein